MFGFIYGTWLFPFKKSMVCTLIHCLLMANLTIKNSYSLHLTCPLRYSRFTMNPILWGIHSGGWPWALKQAIHRLLVSTQFYLWAAKNTVKKICDKKCMTKHKLTFFRECPSSSRKRHQRSHTDVRYVACLRELWCRIWYSVDNLSALDAYRPDWTRQDLWGGWGWVPR